MPVRLDFGPVDRTKARVKLDYDTWAPGEAFVPLLQGYVRLWMKHVNVARDKRPVEDGGDWIKPGTVYDLSQLTTAGSTTVTLYAEGLNPSFKAGDVRIAASLDPDGAGPIGFIASDATRMTVVNVNVLIGADSASDASLRDDWVGAKDSSANREHRILNWLTLDGPNGLERQIEVKQKNVSGGGSIVLQSFDLSGAPFGDGDFSRTMTVDGSGGNQLKFIIRGNTVSAAPDDVSVTASFMGQVFGTQSITVIQFNPEVETSGTSPVPVNPAIVSADASDVDGNVFAVDVGKPGFNNPADNHSSQYPGGALLPVLTGSPKFNVGTIEVLWGRLINAAGAVVMDRSTDAGSPLQVNPPNKGFGNTDPDNFRVRDTYVPSWAETANAPVEYLFGHPSEASDTALDLFAEDNYAAKIVAQAAPTIVYPVAVHVMQLVNAAGTVTGSITMSAADVNAMLAHANTVWSQAGIRFSLASGNLFSPQKTLNTDEFDVLDNDASTTADDVVAINNVANAIDIYIVRTITNENIVAEDEAIAGTTRIPSMWGSSGVLIARELKDTEPPIGGNITRIVDEMGRTLAHELGHFLADSGSHDGRVWNLMLGGDSSDKRDISDDDGDHSVNDVRTSVNPASPE